MVRLGKHALESSQRPTDQDQPIPQINPDQMDEIQKARPAVIQNSNLSNLNYTPQTDSTYLDSINTPQGNLNAPEDILSKAPFSSDLDQLFGNQDLSSLGEGSFETFFENFLDFNFPTCLGEQSLGGYDAFL